VQAPCLGQPEMVKWPPKKFMVIRTVMGLHNHIDNELTSQAEPSRYQNKRIILIVFHAYIEISLGFGSIS